MARPSLLRITPFRRSLSVVALLCLLLATGFVQGRELEPVRMQLRWMHQFQFAGYYAAVEQGYYADAGFDVTLVEGAPNRQPVTEVLAGRADFAEANSELLFARLQGEPLVALAVIFQHSPSVLLTLAESGIETPMDLVGKKMMVAGGHADVDFMAMLHSAEVPVDQVELLPSSYQIEDLLTGKTDAFNSYLTNEPFYLEERGVDYRVINPRDYDEDFFSDILFTREAELKKTRNGSSVLLGRLLRAGRGVTLI